MGVLVLVALPVLVGALAQRSTGVGLALVGAPFLVVALGPADGVTFGNTLQVVLCAAVLAQTWRGTEWRVVGLLLAGGAVGVPLGAVVVAVTPDAPLMVVVGSLAALGVALSVVPAAGRVLAGTVGGLGAGAGAGFVNAAAGVGGPLISAYAIARRMPPERFVPTAQVVLLVVNLGAVATKGPPSLPPSLWITGLVALAIGTTLGGPVARRLDPVVARRAVLVIAGLGALATVAQGVARL